MTDNNVSTQVDELLRNAELRTELEPYLDESLSRVDVRHWSLSRENDYLALMLDWERAPILPIADWFNPPLAFEHPSNVADAALPGLLDAVIGKLYEKQIVLDFTDHLSDRALYTLIVLEILPTREKKVEKPECFRHWDCSYVSDEYNQTDVWLAYYASDEERADWEEQTGRLAPPKRLPLYPRILPGEAE